MKPITIIVDSRLRILRNSLEQHVSNTIEAAFTHVNPQFLLKKKLGIPAWSEPRVYKTFTHEDEMLSLPRGGMSRLRKILEDNKIRYTIQDRRTAGKAVKAGFLPPTKMVLRDYQKKMLEAAVARENCLLKAGTGSGKTTVAIALASHIGLYTLIIVWSANLFDQWVERIEGELGIKNEDIGIIRGSKTKIRPITVAMQQTIAARKELEDILPQFGCVIADEVQRAAASTMFQAMDIWPAKYRIGISADHSRKDKKEFLIHDLFGDVAADIKRDDLIEEGSVLEVEIRVIPTEFRADWYKDTHDFNALLEAMMEDETRNELVINTVSSELSHGQQAFLLSHRREHCVDLSKRIARSGYKAGLLLGGQGDAETFAQTKIGLDSGAILCGVGTIQAIAQGLDIPRIGRAVVATPMASNKQLFGQARGRVCRTAKHLGKKDAVLYYLYDRHVYGLKHLENLCAWNNVVKVKDGANWVPARDYIKREKNRVDVADELTFDFLSDHDKSTC